MDQDQPHIIVYGDSFAEDSPRIGRIRLVTDALARRELKVTRDPTSGRFVPENAAEWSKLLEGSGLPLPDAVIEAELGRKALLAERDREIQRAFDWFQLRQREGPCCVTGSAAIECASMEWSRRLRQKVKASEAAAAERECNQVVLEQDDW